MTDRNDLTQQITDVLREHMLIRWDRASWWCECGEDCLTVEGPHDAHAARAVTDQLIVWLAEDRYARLKALLFQVASRETGPKFAHCTMHLAEECDCR